MDKIDIDIMEADWFRMAITPMPYQIMTYGGKWKERNKAYYAYKKEIQWAVNIEKFVPSGCLEMIFILPVPKSWSEVKKERMEDTPHLRTPDLSNLIKGVEDALFYKRGGDQHIYYLQGAKFWGMKGMIAIRNCTGLVNLF